jgi:hypothetical protein
MPLFGKQPTCRACHAPIIFMMQKGKTDAKPNPLNPAPHPNGNLRLVTGEGYEVLTGDELKAAQDRKEPLYLSHFVNCPARSQFRSKKPGAKK